MTPQLEFIKTDEGAPKIAPDTVTIQGDTAKALSP